MIAKQMRLFDNASDSSDEAPVAVVPQSSVILGTMRCKVQI